jgi:hypothetical protein
MFGVILTVMVRWISDGLSRGTFVAGISSILFVLSYPGVYNLHNVVHVGLGEHLFVLLGCVAIYSNRFAVLCLVTAVSCLVKESVGFLIVPTYFVSAMLFSTWRTALLRTACLAAVFLAPFCLLRSGMLFHNHSDIHTYASFYTWNYVQYCYNYWGGLKGAAVQIALYCGPLCLIAGPGFFLAPPRLKALAVLPILATLQIALATDVMRMVGVGIPVLIALSVFALRRLNEAHAALICSLAGFHFLCVNHGVGSLPSLEVASLLIVGLLWLNRCAFSHLWRPS